MKKKINDTTELIRLNNFDYSAKEIGLKLNTCRTNINYWRKKLKLKPKITRLSFGFKKILCDIINSEPAIEPYSDNKIVEILKEKYGIIRTNKTIYRTRIDLKIIQGEKYHKINGRRYAYFTKGRIIWDPEGKHRLIKRNIKKEE